MPSIQKRVVLLLSNGFELIETSCFTDVMAWASFMDGIDIHLDSVGLHEELDVAFGGMKIKPPYRLQDVDLEKYDALAIPGGMEFSHFYDDAYSGPFLNAIKHFDTYKKPIAAVCVASLALAKAGILKGRQATVYHSETGTRKMVLEEYGAHFVDQPVVVEDHVITSTGPGTSVEVALKLLEKLTSKDISEETRRLMRVSKPDGQWFKPQVEDAESSH
ncbi:MAG: DJ-1/PfpI family protein [Crocosphaera sp.]